MITRAAPILLIVFGVFAAASPTRGQTNHDLIHREFAELVRVLAKGQPVDCKRANRETSGCFVFSTNAQRQTIWQFTSDTAMTGGSAHELCSTVATRLLEPGKDILKTVSGMMNEPMRTSLMCTFNYVRLDHGKR